MPLKARIPHLLLGQNLDRHDLEMMRDKPEQIPALATQLPSYDAPAAAILTEGLLSHSDSSEHSAPCS